MMRIAILIDRLNIGGVERAAIMETIALTNKGYEVFLWVLSSNSIVEGAFAEYVNEIDIRWLDTSLPKIMRKSFRIPGFSFLSFFHFTFPVLLPRFAKLNKVDAIISHGTYTTLTGIQIAKRLKVPLYYYLHDPASYIMNFVYSRKRPKFLWNLLTILSAGLDRYLIRACAEVLLPGDLHLAYVNKCLQKSRKSGIVIPWGVYSEQNLPNTRGLDIISVTSWKRGKGVELLFSLADKIPDMRILLVGAWIDQNYRNEVQRELARRKLEDHILITGLVSEIELVSLYRSARATIIVNAERGFGLSTIEAAAQGCAVIAPFECGAASLFKNGESALFYPYGDMEVAAALLRSLISNEQQADSIGREAWRTVRDRYSWDHHVTRLISELGISP